MTRPADSEEMAKAARIALEGATRVIQWAKMIVDTTQQKFEAARGDVAGIPKPCYPEGASWFTVADWMGWFAGPPKIVWGRSKSVPSGASSDRFPPFVFLIVSFRDSASSPWNLRVVRGGVRKVVRKPSKRTMQDDVKEIVDAVNRKRDREVISVAGSHVERVEGKLETTDFFTLIDPKALQEFIEETPAKLLTWLK